LAEKGGTGRGSLAEKGGTGRGSLAEKGGTDRGSLAEKGGTGRGSSPGTSVLPCQYLSTNVRYTYFVQLPRGALRHCATSQKVAGSIPDNVIGIFHSHNPSGRTMTLGLTQPLTEMSTRNISWG